MTIYTRKNSHIHEKHISTVSANYITSKKRALKFIYVRSIFLSKVAVCTHVLEPARFLLASYSMAKIRNEQPVQQEICSKNAF